MKTKYIVLGFIILISCETKIIEPDNDLTPPVTNELIISEVRITSVKEEGDYRNTYFEIYNGTNQTVNLSNYGVQYSKNGAAWNTDDDMLEFNGSLDPTKVIIIARLGTDPAIINTPDFVWEALKANGNDGIALVKNIGGSYEVIDQFGEPYTTDNDPGLAWSIAGVEEASKDHVLLRKWNVADANINWINSVGINSENSEWIVMEKDFYGNMGTYTPKSME